MTVDRTSPIGNVLSVQMRQLAALAQSIAAAAENAAALDAVLDALVRMKGWFPRALLLKAEQSGGPFVTIDSRGAANLRRDWSRWPLHRLFVRMQPSRIVDPITQERTALAIPFVHGAHRWVVVADITKSSGDTSLDDFFAVLESFCVVHAPDMEREGPTVDTIPPVVTALALCDDVRERVEASLQRRGWSFTNVAEFGALSRSLKQAVPDIILVDAHVLRDPLAAITNIHRTADRGSLRLLAFHQGEFDGQSSRSLVDKFLPHDADGATIFRAIKELKRESSALRARRYDEESLLAMRRAAGILTPRELADFGAERAAEILDGWASCFLLDPRGGIYRQQYPAGERQIVRSIPKGFLNDGAIFAQNVGDQFLEEITDDPVAQFAIVATGAVSGASIPLISRSGRHHGIIVAFSTKSMADSQSFATLESFARILAQRFEQLHSGGESIPEFRGERLWQRLRAGTLRLDVYRSAGCTIPWHYKIEGDTRALLSFGFSEEDGSGQRLSDAWLAEAPLARTLEDCGGDRPCFAAAVDLAAQSMSYATRGFSPPLVGEGGGVTVIRGSRDIVSGTTVLRSSRATICDGTLWAWLQRGGKSVDRLVGEINEERPVGFASIVTLD